MIFRQLYETLVRVDCAGAASAGLASSWQLEPDGETWRVTLRENARFADETPVTSAGVLSAWSGGVSGSELRPQTRRLIRSAVAVDERTLAVTLTTPRTGAPLALAHTDLAIYKRVAGSPWPAGTRPARMEVTAQAITINSTSFRVAGGRDARDLLDEGADLLITRDPRVLGYAATLPQFLVVPLEWQRVHAFLSPWRNPATPPLSGDAREDLAADAVRGEARGAQEPFWWESLESCQGGSTFAPPASPANGRIVYQQTDSVARDLAERLVGLASAPGPAGVLVLDALLPDRSRLRAVRPAGLDEAAFAAARQRGDDAGYILEFERRPLDPCREFQILTDSFPWFDSKDIVPLVDTRMQAIVRRGRSGLVREWDGGLIVGSKP